MKNRSWNILNVRVTFEKKKEKRSPVENNSVVSFDVSRMSSFKLDSVSGLIKF